MKAARHLERACLALLLTTGCGATPTGASLPSKVALPGARFFPESVSATRDGTLFVGSLATGEILRVHPATSAVEPFASTGAGVTGVFVDDAAGSVWVCRVDQSQTPRATEVWRLSLATGERLARHAFATPAFCNDFAVDGERNVYVSDSYGKVWRLAGGEGALEVLSDDPRLAPSRADGFGANGIAYDGRGSLLVTTNADGRLLRIPLDGGAPTEIEVSLESPDGIRALDARTLLVVEAVGRLSKVTIDGQRATATPLAGDLAWPTSVAVVGGHAWVSEGQLGALFGVVPGPPALS